VPASSGSIRQSYLASYASTKLSGAASRRLTSPSTTATRAPSRWTVARGSARRWRALTDSGEVENTSAPSIHRAHTGLTCGGPSARAVQSQ
jgi:hypothetical protein